MARDKTRDEQPASILPKARALEEKTSPYTRFLGWASLNMPGFWRLRLEILLIGYVVLFLGAVGTPVIFAGMAGPRDTGVDCDNYRWEQETQAAIKEGRELPYIDFVGGRDFRELKLEDKYACAGSIRHNYYPPEPAPAPAPEYYEPAPAPADPAPVDPAAPAEAAPADPAATAAPPVEAVAPADAAAAPVDPYAPQPAPAYQPEPSAPYVPPALYSRSEFYGWTGGFNSGEQTGIMTIFVIVAMMFALVWAFFVARGTRLRDVIGKTDAPSFATCAFALAPLVVLPILAGHIAFAASHGDAFNALLQGKAMARLPEGETIDVYFGGSTYSNGLSLAMLFLGGVIAVLIAMCLKIIMYDGVIGLLRTSLMALAISVPAIALAIVAYGMTYGATGMSSNTALAIVTLVLLAFLGAIWLLYRKDLVKGVRRRMTRPLAFAFLMLWPFWYGFASIIAGAVVFELAGTPTDSMWVVWVYLAAAFVVGVFIQSQLFRGIARISLLPRP